MLVNVNRKKRVRRKTYYYYTVLSRFGGVKKTLSFQSIHINEQRRKKNENKYTNSQTNDAKTTWLTLRSCAEVSSMLKNAATANQLTHSILFAQRKKRKISENKCFYLYFRVPIFCFRVFWLSATIHSILRWPRCFISFHTEVQLFTMIRTKHQRKPSDFAYPFYHTAYFALFSEQNACSIHSESERNMEARTRLILLTCLKFTWNLI